jgi:hypothetical protein
MIINKDTMYTFCEIIRQLEPDKLLDIGLFYKAIGGVARNILDFDIPESCYITGVTSEDISKLGIYNTIYNRIIDNNKLIECGYKEYRLAIMLSDSVSEEDKPGLMAASLQAADYILLYKTDVKYLPDDYNKDAVKVINDEYCLVPADNF